MYKKLILLSSIFLSCNAFAYDSIDSIFNRLSHHRNVTATEVRYSGSFSPDCSGFVFQRGDGDGWTKGVRLTLTGASPSEVSAIREVFKKDGSQSTLVEVDAEKLQACYDEKRKIGYAFKYDENTSTLYLLRADVDDKICIPIDWHERDYHFAPVPTLEINWPAAAARLYTEIKYNSPFYRKVQAKVEKAYEEALEELRDADDYEAYRALEKLAASCGDGHTFIYTTGKMKDKPVASPFSTILIGGRLFVDHVDSEELSEAGMRRGMEVISVNSERPYEYAVRELLPYVCTSTPQWADHLMFDNHRFATGRKGTPFNLVLSDNDGRDSLQLEYTIGKGDWNLRVAGTRQPSFSLREDKIAVLRLPDFASSAVREYFDSIYPHLLETDALVIDLRGNEGGNSSHGDYILSHLTSDSIPTQPWETPIYMPAYASWGQEISPYVHPSGKMAPAEDRKPYLAPVAVLTDRATFSAAEDFCSVFRSMKRGVIIGTPTGGSTGNGVRVALAEGLYANICSKHDYMPDGTEFVGIGIIPDIILEPTPDSYFSLQPNDVVLDKAVSTLRSRK